MGFAYGDRRAPNVGGLVSALLDAARRAGPAWIVVFASLALSLLGVYAIDVATSAQSGEALSPLAARQALYLCVGVGAACFALIPNHRSLGAASWIFLGLAVLLMIFLLIPGVPSSIVRPRNGARSWIDVGPLDFQPSELAKIAYVLVMAWYLRYSRNHRTIKGLIPPAIITVVPVGLITLQPDLGTATLFVPSLFAMLVAAGARLKHLALVVLIAAAAAPAAYPMLKPHQKERFVGLVKQFQGDSSGDQDINMQSVTAQRLAAAGGTSGLDEQKSRVLLRYNALPERHNDMIYSVIVNRFGLVGGVGTLLLYAVWVGGALLTAATCREPFGRLAIVGLTAFIGAQVFINVGMNVGLVPIIGITLPFVSHGGSSLVTVWIMTGLIFSIAVRQPEVVLHRSLEWED